MKLIVPVLNRYDMLNRMVSSIDYEIEHLLIIDNGGELESLAINDFVKDLTILKMPSNQGVAGGWNLGIKCFPFEPVWFFSSADTVYKSGALSNLATAKPENITLASQFPHWQTFAIGEKVVQKIGLFDESIYPIYFEDNDYMRRAEIAGIKIEKVEMSLDHDNSSTINSDNSYKQQNNRTYMSNQSYYELKNPSDEGRWDLGRRRANNWAK
jgi:GT2 family glycosyltransferase